MIDHVGLFVRDYARSLKFYTEMLRPLGYELVAEVSPEQQLDPEAARRENTLSCIAMFGPPGGGKPFQIAQATGATSPAHVALRCSNQLVVDAVYRAGIAAGGRDNGAPGPRSFMPPDYYGGFLFDPDGNEIEPLCWGVRREDMHAATGSDEDVLRRNKALVVQFYRAIESPGASRDTLEAFVAPEFVNYGVPPGYATDREGLKAFFDDLRKGFPDGQSEFHHVVAEGDLVMAYKTNHGTHLGEFMGIPPTGRKVHTQSVKMFKVSNNRIVAHWHVVDVHGMMAQIGLGVPGSRPV